VKVHGLFSGFAALRISCRVMTSPETSSVECASTEKKRFPRPGFRDMIVVMQDDIVVATDFIGPLRRTP